ncbi:MAG: LuxR C-terminal-related transcriptional regulator, partial [Actinomycetota bacterium]
GAGWNHPVDHIISGIGQFWSGEWDEALASLSLGFDIGDTTGVRRASVAGRSVASLISLHRGDLGAAEHEVAIAEVDYERSAPQWRADWMFWARALKIEAEGRRAEALQTLVKAWELCRDAGVVGEFPVIGPDLVRLALICGENLLAEEATAALEAMAGGSGVPGVQGAALRCRGLVDGDAAVLLQAVASYRRSPRRRALALSCEDAAVALAHPASRSGAERTKWLGSETGQQARHLADEALAVFRGLDARRDLARAHARLQAAGLGQAPSRKARTRPGTGAPGKAGAVVGQAAGEQAVGGQTAGGRAVGEKAAGEQAVGERAVGERAVGERAAGEQAAGEQAVGEKALGGLGTGRSSGGPNTGGRAVAGQTVGEPDLRSSPTQASPEQLRPNLDSAHEGPAGAFSGLTQTESQVVSHVAQGLSNRQIAELFQVSPRTIQSHVSASLRKLGLASRVELAVWTSSMLSG